MGPIVKGIKSFFKWKATPFFKGSKIKVLTTFEKTSFPDPLCQFQPNLPQKIFMWKGHTLFQRKLMPKYIDDKWKFSSEPLGLFHWNLAHSLFWAKGIYICSNNNRSRTIPKVVNGEKVHEIILATLKYFYRAIGLILMKHVYDKKPFWLKGI